MNNDIFYNPEQYIIPEILRRMETAFDDYFENEENKKYYKEIFKAIKESVDDDDAYIKPLCNSIIDYLKKKHEEKFNIEISDDDFFKRLNEDYKYVKLKNYIDKVVKISGGNAFINDKGTYNNNRSYIRAYIINKFIKL